MVKTDGKMTYVLSNGKTESDVTSYYDDRVSEFVNEDAFFNTSVNPVISVVGTINDTDTTTPTSIESSAMFMEIRKGPHTLQVSNDYSDKIGNRILPTTTDLSDHSTCTQNCSSTKIKVYDSNVSDATKNRLLKYNTSDYPASTTLGIDIDNYDYFILINPDIVDSTTREDTVRPHFAKITKIISFDEFGDGVEFEPRYPSYIQAGTKFEIFKGPSKSSTDIVAVSYGLRGDTSASTKKYDEQCIVDRPTFYFYNDRLEVENQLDYSEKYTLTSQRWWDYYNAIYTISNHGYNENDEGSTSKYFVLQAAEYNKLCEGMSIFDKANSYLGNVESLYYDSGSSEYRFFLDFARIGIPEQSDIPEDEYRIGKTIQNVVFTTTGRYRTIIPNLGRQKFDAELIDNLKDYDEQQSDSTFDPIFWDKSFTKMKRDSSDLVSNTNFNTLTGPSRYITFEPTTLKNSKVPFVVSHHVNSSSGSISKLAQISVNDVNGLNSTKIKNGDTLKIYNSLHNDRLNSVILPHKATFISSSNKIRLLKVSEEEDYKKSQSIKQGTIILIENYFYVVDVIDDRNASNYQEFTTQARRLNAVNTNSWSEVTTIHSFQEADITVSRYNGKFRVGIESDTEVDYDSNNRLTVNNITTEKENAKLYKSILSISKYNKHNNYIDYADKKMKLLTMQTTDELYQDTAIDRFYYYGEGSFSINRLIFDGYVEQTRPEVSRNIVNFYLEGRDKTANLLTDTVTEDLQFTEDIIHSSLNPLFDLSNTQTATGTTLSGNTVVVTGDNTLNRYTLLFDNNGNLIGEVNTSTYSSPNTTHTLYDDVYVTSLPSTTIKYHYPFSDANYISGTKALMANPEMSNRTDDFQSISEKGVIFQSGFDIDSTLAKNTLIGTSNSGKFNTNNTLGFDIAAPKAITADVDSHFAFKITNENLADIEYISKSFVNSEAFDVTEIIKQNNQTSTLVLAPRFPIVMGRLESNTLDTRTSDVKMYFVNNNINDAGFIHRLQDTFTTYVGPKETIRYWDLQRFDFGTISSNLDSIYKNTRQKISGYSLGYSINSIGTDGQSISNTESLTPINGSNVINENYEYLTDFGFDDKPPLHYIREGSSTALSERRNISSNELENIDKLVQPYELLSVGDLFPYSYLRYNNLGYHAFDLKDMGILLQSESTKGNKISHSSYVGKTSKNELQEINFERNKVNSASITNAQSLFRYGIVRLVEATFDWHFNPVDIERFQEKRVPNFGYQRYQEKDLGNTGDNITTSGGNTIQNNTGSTITLTEGDAFFDTVDGSLIAFYNGTSGSIANGSSLTSTADIKTFSNGTFTVYRHKRFNENTFDLFASPNTGLNSLSTDNSISLSRVLLAKTPVYTADGKFKLAAAIDHSTNDFTVPSIYLPLISKNKGTNSSFSNEPTTSVFHIDDNWTEGDSGGSYRHMHMSRILAAHTHDNFDTNLKTIYDGYGIPADSDVYKNCIAIFTDFKSLTDNSTTVQNHMITSCPLADDDRTGYAYIDQDDSEQHSPTLVSFDSDSTEYAIQGINSNKIFLENKEGSPIDFTDTTNSVVADHSSVPSTAADLGELYSANMFIKPKFDFTSSDITISNSSITIDLDDSNHVWMDYMPNLTNYYLVSERGLDELEDRKEGIETNFNSPIDLDAYENIHPALVLRIISHTKTNPNPSGGVAPTHTLTFDKNISGLTFNASPSSSTIGNVFRLMRFAETTFEQTENEIYLNRMFKSNIGRLAGKEIINFETGNADEIDGNTGDYIETVYSMYLPLSVDTLQSDGADTYLERRTFDEGKVLFAEESKLMYITDGTNSQIRNITVEKTEGSSGNPIELKMTFDGSITGNGVVSFGEMFSIDLPNTPKLQNIKKCYIGTTFSIGEQTESYIQEITRRQGLDFDFITSSTEYTGNIVNSVSSNTITCTANVTGITAGDVIYTNDGYLLGEVSSISTTDITLTELFYTPSQYDEIKKYEKRTHVSINNFINTNVFDAVKLLTSKKGMDYRIKNNKVLLRNLENTDSLIKININHKRHNLISIVSDDSLFDYANSVTVVGDKVRSTAEYPVNPLSGINRSITHIDTTIRTELEAKIKANQLLSLYTDNSIRKITIEVEKTGLEMLEAGDIITLDFPQRGIPKGDYYIFEITNLLSGILEMKVGTFGKTIAERLTELNIQQNNQGSLLLGENAIVNESTTVLQDLLKLSVASIEYTITGTAPTANMGFDDTLGFGEVVGFETTTGQELADYYAEDNL